MRLEVRARGREPEAWLARGGDGAWVTGGVGAVDVCAFGAVERLEPSASPPEEGCEGGVAFLLIDVAGVWRGHAKKGWP